MLDLGILGLKFENTIVIIEISALEFPLLQNFMHEYKCLHLGSKVPCLGIFGLELKKNYNRSQHHRICQK